MSGFATVASVISAAAAVAGVFSGNQQAKAQEKAQKAALAQQERAMQLQSQQAQQSASQMQKQLKMQEESLNAANQKNASSTNILAQIADQANAGQAGTMLTGPQGLDMSQQRQTLGGGSTLLGG
jgi:uncharacterized protein HemX